MKTAEDLKALYPHYRDIPADSQILAPLHQKSLLLNGQLKIWNGATRQVLSPLLTRGGDGQLEQVDTG